MKTNFSSTKNSENQQQHKITVYVRYQSVTASIEINKNASLMALFEKAIQETGQDSGQKDRFQLKLDGQVLDLHKKIGDYPITDGTTLILSLTAGGGGNYGCR